MVKRLSLGLALSTSIQGTGASGTPYIPVGPTYFISAAGSDSNDGLTVDTPWQTITKVNATVIPVGYNVAFRGGDTFTGNLVVDAGGSALTNTIYCSYGIGRATLNAGALAGVDASDQSYVTITNLKLVGNATTNDKCGVLFQNNAADASKIPGCQATYLDISGFGRCGIAVFGNEVYGADPVLAGYIGVIIDHCTVDNCAFNWLNTCAGIKVTSESAYGAKWNREHGYASMPYAHQNVTITYCSVTNCPGKAAATNWTGSGIIIAESHTGLIENCYAKSNGTASTNSSGPVGIWTADSYGVVIRYNASISNRRASGNDGGGYDIDAGCINCTIEYNYSADNYGPGQMMYSYDDPGYIDATTNCIIRYNISYNDATSNFGSLFAQNDGSGNWSGCAIHNNVFIQKGTNLKTVQLGGGADTIVDIMDNIFWAENGSKLIVDAGSPLSGVRLRGNLYYAPGVTNIITWAAVTYTTIAAWRTASGQETSGATDTSKVGDPLFVSSPASVTVPAGTGYPVTLLTGYKLQSGSPATLGGISISAFGYTQPATDYFGDPTYTTGIGASATPTGLAPAIQPVQAVTAPNYLATALSSTVGTTVRWEVRRPFYISKYGASELILSYCNDYATRAGGAAGNAMTINSAAIEKDGGTCTQLTFDAGVNTSKTLAYGDTDIQTDRLIPGAFGLTEFTPGDLYWERLVYELPLTTSTYPLVATIQSLFTGFAAYKMTTGTAATAVGTGALVATGKTAVSGVKIFCGVVLGRPVTSGKAYINANTSTDRDQDAPVAAGALPLNLFAGVFERSMLDQFSTVSNISPFINAAVFGTVIKGYVGSTDRRKAYYKYTTDFLDGYGINDAAGTTTLQELKDALTALWATYKTEVPAGRIWRNKLRPDVTSTDAFATYGNQTVGAKSQSGGIIYDINVWFDTRRTAGDVEGVIPVGRFRNPANFEQVRVSDGVANWMISSDNVHPTAGVGFPALASETRCIMHVVQSAVPAALSGVTVAASDTTITAVWTKPANAPTDYLVEIRLTSGGAWTSVHTWDDAPTYCWTGLTSGTSYDISITPINYKGSGSAYTATQATAATPSGLVLDGLATAPVQAISTRRLRSAYSGPVFHVRRLYDGLETAVYFNAAGDLDTAFLLGWANGGDVILKRAYDQMAAANHELALYTSKSVATWPTLVQAGVLKAVNGKAAPYYDGARYFSTSSLSSVPAANTRSGVMAIHFPVQPASAAAVLGGGATSGFHMAVQTNDRMSMEKKSVIAILSPATTMGRNPTAISFTYDGANAQIWKDGTSIGTASSAQTFSGSGTVPLGVGNNADSGSFIIGYEPERVIWDAVPSVGDRQAVENSARTYWGTA